MSEKKSNKLFNTILGLIILTILAAIVVPNFIRARTTSAQNACINNLRLIDGAKQQWALEYQKVSTDIPTSTDLQPYLGRGTGLLPSCPDDPSHSFDHSYRPNAVKDSPTCRIYPDNPGHQLP